MNKSRTTFGLTTTFALFSFLAALGQQPTQQKGSAGLLDPFEAIVAPQREASSTPNAAPVVADPSGKTSTAEATAESMAEMEKQLADMKKKMESLEKELQANAPKKPQEGEWQDLSGEKWTVKLGGHVQADYVNWAKASPAIVGDQDYFEFRRLRLVAEGTGYGVYDFRLQMTLEPETVGQSGGTATSPDIKDAYFSVNEIPAVGRFRIGNFFVPFGLEQVTNAPNHVFLERSIPTQGVFSADREVGAAFYNHNEDLSLTWAGGIFFDSISETLKERIDDNQGYRLSGRVVAIPYFDEPSNGRYVVHTGAGILHTDDQDERVRFRARPNIHEGPRLIDSGVLDADTYTTGNLEGAIVYGPLTLQSEAYLCSVNRTAQDAVALHGAYVHMSYFLTGENRTYERFGQHGSQFGRSQPFTNFFLVPGGSGWGAWEAKARWTHLDLSNLNRGQYNDFTFGGNWYWSDRARWMFDWIHPITSSGATFGAADADILGLRFDWSW